MMQAITFLALENSFCTYDQFLSTFTNKNNLTYLVNKSVYGNVSVESNILSQMIVNLSGKPNLFAWVRL